MIIFKVDAQFPAMERQDIERELSLIRDTLAGFDCGLIGIDLVLEERRLVAYLCADTESMIIKTFKLAGVVADNITSLGRPHDTYIDFMRYGHQQERPEATAWPLPSSCFIANPFGRV